MIISKWYILPYEKSEDYLGNINHFPKYTDNSSVIKFSSFLLNEPVNCLVCLTSDIAYHNQLIDIGDAYIVGDEELADLFNSKFNKNLSIAQILEILEPLSTNVGD